MLGSSILYMKPYFIILAFLLSACSNNKYKMNNESYVTEKDILKELDKAFLDSYPLSTPIQQSNYDFFLDLEPPYTIVAGSRIHLYADSLYWAVIFETNGYNTRAGLPQIELIFVGNCIDYEYQNLYGQKESSNISFVNLMTPKDVDAIQNKEGSEAEQFEMLGKDVTSINIRDTIVTFMNDYKDFNNKGIRVRDYDNPNHLIGFEELFRYLYETQPEIVSATENDIKKRLIQDIPHIMSINEFHYISAIEQNILPSKQELFQLIAKVLITKDTSYWKPTLPPNNHWSNWESGIL